MTLNETVTVTQEQRVTEVLQQLQTEMSRSGDEQSALRLKQIAEKAERDELNIAFCGHFSAGKSTLINRLVGRDVLSSGPIPTSANVVYIRKGTERASVKLKDGAEWKTPLDELGSYLCDGDRVETVHVELPLSGWPDGTALLDTPGVDSTDDAHRVATESALHLADVVLYVTDYHHVQSEVNFQFTKKLQEREKSVIWIVNQVDKHQEWEVPFDQFREQLTASFRDWELDVAAVYFTSMTEPGHPCNELPQLKHLLKQLVTDRADWLRLSLNRSVQDVLRQHREWLWEEQLSQREQLEHVLASEQCNLEDLGQLREQLRHVREAPAKLGSRMQEELAKLLKNAPITPYQTRELARLYLESRQSGFKVGWLFAGKKTEQEAERRFSAFAEDFRKKVSAHIDWHVKELLVRLIREAGLHDSDYEAAVYALTVNVEPELLSGKVKENLTSNEYVLTYMDQLAEEVKRRYKSAAASLIEQAVERKTEQSEKEQAELKERLARVEKVLQAQKQLDRLDQTVYDRMERLETLWIWNANRTELSADFDEWLRRAAQQAAEENNKHINSWPTLSANPMALANERQGAVQKYLEQDEPPVSSQEKLQKAAQMLQTAADTLSGKAGFQNIVQAMRQRAVRLAEREFTVALFGAFSAGKSSFANAMIGEPVLPVSPNPTTATVNRLVHPEEGLPHGTARVKFKSEEELEADVAASLALFQETYRGIDSLRRQVARLSKGSHRANAKPHLAFLQAVADGWDPVMKEELGTERVVDRETYAAYAAEESKACFVESIDVSIDCPLTREGIELVDTPGADSINARHTGVAFDYIKHADAVIFVTYYNHAFSQADRAFLEQLGRVKDTFEMDKLWFVINAADLARSEEQLQGVRDYVESQLMSCGINRPRLYALSSQTALWAELASRGALPAEMARVYRERLGLNADAPFPEKDDGLLRAGFKWFIDDFKRLTVRELTELAVQGAQKEVRRALLVVRDYAEAALQDKASCERQLRDAETARQTALNEIARLDWQAERQSMEQEVKELLYYVKQRFFHQLSEKFNLAFHPSELKEGHQLEGCLRDFFNMLEQQLERETLTTALLVEKAVHTAERHVYEQLVRKLSGEDDTGRFAVHEPASIDVPSSVTASVELNPDDAMVLLKHFKNAKHFFEQGGKQQMLEAFEHHLQMPLQHYVERQQERFIRYFGEQLGERMVKLQRGLRSHVEEHYEGQAAVLSQAGDSENWQALADRLGMLLQH